MEFALKTLVVIVLLLVIVVILLGVVTGWFSGGENLFKSFIDWVNGTIPTAK